MNDRLRNESTRRECAGGCDARGRRDLITRLSWATLAALTGLELTGQGAGAVPVAEAAGLDLGAGERAYPLPVSDGVTIDREQQVIVVRFQQRIYAFNLACPHENTALRWRQREGHFQCPRHESQYQPDGTFISGRATRHMDRFAVRRAADGLVVNLNQLLRSDQQTQGWLAAFVQL